MTPERIREIFLATKLHYTSERYDYTKFGGRKLRGSLKADKFFYDKFSDKLKSDVSVELFFVSNFMRNFHKNLTIPTFIGDYYNQENFDYLKVWYSYVTKTLPYNFNNYMDESKSIENLIAVGKSLPKIFEDYLQGKITIDILSIFVYKNSDNPEIAMWDIISASDPLFEKLYFIVKKHILFLKYRKILQ